MPKLGKSKLLTVQSFDGNNEERARARYILAFLQTKSQSYAQKASGLSVKAHSRIIQMLSDRGHAYDQPRPGRPVLYTVPLMEAAYEMLITYDEGFLTGPQLLRKLVEAGVLQPSSHLPTFMKHLKAYIESQGQRLITNSTSTTFFIAVSDIAARMKYAGMMLRELSSMKLGAVIFEDETTLEESPHPKGQKHCMPHLHIPGVMKTPSRFYTSKNNRRMLKLAVFCNTIGGIFVKETTGTTYDGYQADKVHKTKRGADAGSIVGDEYVDCVKAALDHYMQFPAFRRLHASAMLVHDKSNVHLSKPVMQALKGMQLRVEVQPPRSPDLMPLDYGIFGFTKNQLERALPKHAKWSDRVQKFKELLTNASAVATIEEFPLRLQACIDSNGEHLQNALKALKKSRSAQ